MNSLARRDHERIKSLERQVDTLTEQVGTLAKRSHEFRMGLEFARDLNTGIRSPDLVVTLADIRDRANIKLNQYPVDDVEVKNC